MTTGLECTVVSIVPFDIFEEKPGLVPGRFHIKAAKEGEVSVLHVGTCLHYVYLDEARGSLQARNPSDLVATSIVNDYCQAQLGISETARPGLFWVPGKLTEEEVKKEHKVKLVQANLAQKAWFLNICRIADDDWQRYHQHNVISTFQRVAAEAIGWTPEQHDWMSISSNVQTDRCPSCTMSNPTGTVVCPNCKCILDVEKHKTLAFA